MDKKRILLVDDEEDMRRMLKFRLEALNYDVSEAGDGQEGLDKAKQENPDLIILDVMMPNMDGFEMSRAIKGDPKHKNIPILMLPM